MLTAPQIPLNARRARVDWPGLACFAVIALIVIIAFLPSLAHAPRADQWSFLMDMMRQESCGDLILNSYSYNRTRDIKPGDAMLFRPVLFVYLSLLACISGSHIWIPQAAGVALHLAIAGLVFSILRVIITEITGNARAATGAAVLAALYFATTPLVMEQVIWAHINAYMVAVLCVLGVLHIQIQALINRGLTHGRIAATFVLTLLAVFTFETTLFLPLILAACAAVGWLATGQGSGTRRSRLGLAAVFAAPLALYCVAYYADLRVHPVENTALPGSVLSRAVNWETAENFLRVLKFSVVHPLVAGKHEGFSGIRLIAAEPAPLLGWLSIFLLVCAAGVVADGGHAARRLGVLPRRIAVLVGVVTIAWIGSSVLIVTAGRVNVQNDFWGVMATSSYHTYAPYLAAMILLGTCAACISAAVRGHSGLRRGRGRLPAVCAALVIVAIAVRTGIVRSVNVQVAAYQAPFVEAVEAINSVRRLDRFAMFRISTETSERLESYQGVPILYTLYARLIDQCGGAYEILADAPHVVRSPANPDCHPILVRPDTNYHYYLHHGEFLGLPFWFGFPDDPRIAGNPYVIRAPTLRAAMSQFPAYQERLFRDLKDGRLAMPRPVHRVVPLR